MLKQLVSRLKLHRGCVTPTVLHNWAEVAAGDMEMIDGYEELPSEAQEKVKRALEQQHVDDKDWNGVRTRELRSDIVAVLIVCRTRR